MLRGEQPAGLAAMAKNVATDMCSFVCDQAVQIHGGYGYMRETLVERLYRDARLYPIGGGTREIMNEVIAQDGRLLMWRSVPRALYVGYALPVVAIAAALVAWLVTEHRTWLQLSVVQFAEVATSALMVGVGALQVARAHAGWRAIAARIAGVAALLHLAPLVASVAVNAFASHSDSAFASHSDSDLELAMIASKVVGYVTSCCVVISAAAIALTSRRLTVVLVVVACGLALLQYPPPVLYDLLYDRSRSDWMPLLYAPPPCKSRSVTFSTCSRRPSTVRR